MELVVYLIIVVISMFTSLLAYNIGYKRGATKILEEWKDWINEKT